MHVVLSASDKSGLKQEDIPNSGVPLDKALASDSSATTPAAAVQGEKLTLEEAWACTRPPLSPVKKLPRVKVKTKSGNSDVPEELRAKQGCSMFACFWA